MSPKWSLGILVIVVIKELEEYCDVQRWVLAVEPFFLSVNNLLLNLSERSVIFEIVAACLFCSPLCRVLTVLHWMLQAWKYLPKFPKTVLSSALNSRWHKLKGKLHIYIFIKIVALQFLFIQKTEWLLSLFHSKRKSLREIFHLLVSSPNGCSDRFRPGWSQELGIPSWPPTWVLVAQYSVITCCFLRCVSMELERGAVMQTCMLLSQEVGYPTVTEHWSYKLAVFP